MSTDVAVARLEEQVKALTQAITDVKVELAATRREVSELKDVATRGRMILVVLATIGSVLGWMIAQANGVLRFIGVK